jgi:5-methylcytosine-specific restriction protein A
MKSFLITFKPATENPDRGWPLDDIQRLARASSKGKSVVEKWRFHNRKDVSIGDRVFLLLQGKGGPAIIGYGDVVGEPEHAGNWQVAVRFEVLVDPVKEDLANRSELVAIDGAQSLWRTQASGVRLPEEVAAELESLVVGRSPYPKGAESVSNPDWTRDELILALSLYLRHRPNPPGKGSKEILELSKLLNRLGEKLFSPVNRAVTFRNANGVYMKLMNFRRLDPEYTAKGKTGLTQGAKAEEKVWKEFADDPLRCGAVADAIVASMDDPEVSLAWAENSIDEDIQEAPEGRLLTRKHIARERDRRLIQSKRNQVLKRQGKLVCEACGFDFAIFYGSRGKGVIECHHTKPIATITPELT